MEESNGALAPMGLRRFSSSHTEEVKVTRSVDYLVLEDDLAVYREIYKHAFGTKAPANFKARFPDNVAEGFAKVKDLQAYLEGNAKSIKKLDKLRLVSQGFLEVARTEGFPQACEHEASVAVDGQLFEAFEHHGTARLDAVVTPVYESHMLFDRKGVVLPTAVYFSYTSGGMRDGAYHLDKVIKVLSADPRAKPVVGDRTRVQQHFVAPGWPVSDVPYYNSSEGSRQYIAFKFSPTQDDMIRMWEKMKTLNKRNPSTTAHQAIFELDLLGLRAAGAAKYDTYHMSDQYSSS